MTNVKSCVGCIHYLRGGSSRALCRAIDDELDETVASPYDGRPVTVFHWLRRPYIDDMRAPGARCGPGATLYQTRPQVWVMGARLSWQALRKLLGMSYVVPK